VIDTAKQSPPVTSASTRKLILGFKAMPHIEHIRGEIERMRSQAHRRRGEIWQLPRTGIPTASADALLDR